MAGSGQSGRGTDVTGWASVAEAVNDRMRERGITQRELAESSGISVATLRKVQHGLPQARNRSTLANISRALGFRDDHLWRIATESPPGTDSASEASTIDALRSDLEDLRKRVEAIEANQPAAGAGRSSREAEK
jgi:transcriptional regulator with XRE-family HTH domain